MKLGMNKWKTPQTRRLRRRKNTKNSPEIEHTAEEQECLAKHRERPRRKSLKFKSTKTEAGSPRITPVGIPALQNFKKAQRGHLKLVESTHAA
jgi:hypothetical protein